MNQQNLMNNNNMKNIQIMENRKISLILEFKSDPNKTTIDNCKLYLEHKNMNLISE
jgi:hypothetical protein